MAELEEKSRQLLKSNIKEIYEVAFWLCRPNRQAAEDLAHEVCVDILTAQPSDLAAIRNVKAFIRQCVANAFVSSGRIARSRSNRTEVAIPEGDGHKLFGVDDRADRAASYMDVRAAIRELDLDERMIIYLIYYRGFKIENAVNEITGLTGSKAFKRHKAVLNRLRELLAEGTTD